MTDGFSEEALLEESYREFESQFLQRRQFWRAPASVMKGTVLFDIFSDFCKTFPDHPSDENTVFYLSEWENVSPTMIEVILWCYHFEHAGIEDVRNLVSFMDRTASVLSKWEDYCGIEMFDGISESVVISFGDPRKEIVDLLKSRGVHNA